MNSQLKIRGNVLIEQKDARTREIISQQRVKNLVVNDGCALVCKMLEGTGTGPYWIALGTGSTPPTLSDSAMEAEVLRVPIMSIGASGSSLSIAAYIGSGLANGYTLREIGLLNAESDGMLFARALISSLVKDSTSTISISWSINVASL